MVVLGSPRKGASGTGARHLVHNSTHWNTDDIGTILRTTKVNRDFDTAFNRYISEAMRFALRQKTVRPQ